MVHIPVPRLLPFTIVLLAMVLSLKTVDLARFVVASWQHPGAASVVTAANAAVPEKASAVPAKVVEPPAPQPAEPPPVSDGERAVLLDLRQRRVELDARDVALSARESVLAAAEQKLATRVDELAALQKRLERLEAGRQQREEAGWQGLVKLYEAMKPRDAAIIFNDLQMPVLLAVLDRMKEAKAAPVLAAMNPEKARDVTAALAQMRMKREAPGNGTQLGG